MIFLGHHLFEIAARSRGALCSSKFMDGAWCANTYIEAEQITFTTQVVKYITEQQTVKIKEQQQHNSRMTKIILIWIWNSSVIINKSNGMTKIILIWIWNSSVIINKSNGWILKIEAHMVVKSSKRNNIIIEKLGFESNHQSKTRQR